MINRETGLNPLVETALKAIAVWGRIISMKFLLPVCSSIAVLTAGDPVQAQDDPISQGRSLSPSFALGVMRSELQAKVHIRGPRRSARSAALSISTNSRAR